jgi:O-antigen ligase
MMMTHLRRFEYALHFFMLVLVSNAFLPLWERINAGDSVDMVEGSPLMRSILLAGYLLALAFLLFQPQQTIFMLARTPWVWALAGLTLLSVFWSQMPSLTFRRAIAALLTTLYALTLVRRFSLLEFWKIFGAAIFSMLVFSLATALLVPEWGVMQDVSSANSWQGVFVHKNLLGLMSVLGLLVFSCLVLVSGGWQRWLWGLASVLSLITLAGSRSVTSWVLTALVLSVLIALKFLTPVRQKNNFLAFLLVSAAGVLALWLAAYRYLDILDFLGKDESLTGRLPIWQAALEAGLQRPWLGWGFGAFWLGWEGPSAEIWSAVFWMPPHVHNGYLELFLQLGFPGLLLGLMVVLFPGIFLLRSLWEKRLAPQTAFLFGLWIFFLVYNLNESDLLIQNKITWVLLVYLNLSVWQEEFLPDKQH